MQIQDFFFGLIRIDGTTYEDDVVIDGGEIRKRDKRPSRKLRDDYGHTCASPKLHPAKKLNRRLDILTVKSRLDRPTRASWKAMKTQADGILARHTHP